MPRRTGIGRSARRQQEPIRLTRRIVRGVVDAGCRFHDRRINPQGFDVHKTIRLLPVIGESEGLYLVDPSRSLAEQTTRWLPKSEGRSTDAARRPPCPGSRPVDGDVPTINGVAEAPGCSGAPDPAGPEDPPLDLRSCTGSAETPPGPPHPWRVGGVGGVTRTCGRRSADRHGRRRFGARTQFQIARY